MLCSPIWIPIFLADRSCRSVSLVANNCVHTTNMQVFNPLYARRELFETALFKNYSVITDSDYVWEVKNNAGVFNTQSPEVDQRLKAENLRLATPQPRREQLHSFHFGDDSGINNFQNMVISTPKFTARNMRQGPPFWSYKKTLFSTNFDKCRIDVSASIEDVFRYGGAVEIGGTQYTVVFSPKNSYMRSVPSRNIENIIEIKRYPPVQSSPHGAQINVRMDESVLRHLKSISVKIPSHTLELQVPVSDTFKEVAWHMLSNETRRYCVHAEHTLLDTRIVSKISGAQWYIDRLLVELGTFYAKLQARSQTLNRGVS